jgi:hypothetical protein
MNALWDTSNYSAVYVYRPPTYNNIKTIRDKSDTGKCGSYTQQIVNKIVYLNEPFTFTYMTYNASPKSRCRLVITKADRMEKPNEPSKTMDAVMLDQRLSNGKKRRPVRKSEKLKNNDDSEACELIFRLNVDSAEKKRRDKCGEKFGKLFCGDESLGWCSGQGSCVAKKPDGQMPMEAHYNYSEIDKSCINHHSKHIAKVNTIPKTRKNPPQDILLAAKKPKSQVIFPINSKLITGTDFFECPGAASHKLVLTKTIDCELCQISLTYQTTGPKDQKFEFKECFNVWVGGEWKNGELYQTKTKTFNNLDQAQHWLDSAGGDQANLRNTIGWWVFCGSALFMGILFLSAAAYAMFKKRVLYNAHHERRVVPAIYLDQEKELYY